MSELVLLDEATEHDLRTFASRARALDEQGALRLQAVGATLAVYAAVLPGRGLLGEGLVLGLRTAALAEPAELDVTVPVGAVLDRLARSRPDHRLPVPPMTVPVPWAGQSPPRTGWAPHGEVATDELVEAARAGVAEVASGAPADAGTHAVTALRERVWARRLPGAPMLPAGAAFAAYTLGLVRPGEVAQIRTHGRWIRLSTSGGHVLTR